MLPFVKISFMDGKRFSRSHNLSYFCSEIFLLKTLARVILAMDITKAKRHHIANRMLGE
jgi:hypothetical protein